MPLHPSTDPADYPGGYDDWDPWTQNKGQTTRCREGEELHPITRQCVPKCKPGMTRDPRTGYCVQKCPDGKVRDTTTGDCVPDVPDEVTCDEGWSPDPETGECVPDENGNGDGNGDGNGEDQPEYRYYGTDPNQPWDVDLDWVRDAPPFEFEYDPWVAADEFTFPSYETPDPYAKPEDFSYGAFEPPTAAQLLSEDPGYRFRVGEGVRALEASAASRGTLRGGGTLKGLMDYGQRSASQEYEKAYARRLQDYQTNRATASDVYKTNLGAGLNAYRTNLGMGQTAYNLQRQNAFENEMMNRESAFNAYITNYNNRYTAARDRYQPQLSSWAGQQSAARQASMAKYGRQWDAYRYSQPSGSQVFTFGVL